MKVNVKDFFKVLLLTGAALAGLGGSAVAEVLETHQPESSDSGLVAAQEKGVAARIEFNFEAARENSEAARKAAAATHAAYDQAQSQASVVEESQVALTEVHSTEEWDVVVQSTPVQPATSPEVVFETATPVVEEPQAPTEVAQSLEVETPVQQQGTPISPVVPQTGSDRDVTVSVYGSSNLNTGETNIGQTTSVPVGETGTVKVTTGFGGVSGDGEATDWNNQAIELSGQIGAWEDENGNGGEAYGVVTLGRDAYEGGNDEGYNWSGEEIRLDLTAVAVHRPNANLTFTGEVGVDAVSGQGRIQGDATLHITEELHLTGSAGTDGRSAQLAWYPSLGGNTNLILGVQTIRGSGDSVSRQSAFAGIDLGDVEITVDTSGTVRVNTSLIRF